MVGCFFPPGARLAHWGLASAAALWVGMLVHADVTSEGAWTVFRPGPDDPVPLTASWPFQVPRYDLQPRLELEFGFATDETLVPLVFGDSFTVTVQAADGSSTAILLTADRYGVAWAPASPGTLFVDPLEVQRIPLAFPSLTPVLASAEAYTLGYRLPEALAGRDLVVYCDFFDNANGVASLAFASGMKIQSLPDTVPLTNLVLESSATPPGPYAVESEAVLERDEQRFLLPVVPGQRFYRLWSDLRLRVARVEAVPGELVRLRYAVEPDDLVVEEAAEVTGSYHAVAILGFDGDEQAVWLPPPSGSRYYRVKSATPLRLGEPRLEGGRLSLPYQATPAQLQVHSSAQAAGPYAPETAFSWDTATRQVTLPRAGVTRFFRVRANAVSRITRMTIHGGQLELDYSQP